MNLFHAELRSIRLGGQHLLRLSVATLCITSAQTNFTGVILNDPLPSAEPENRVAKGPHHNGHIPPEERRKLLAMGTRFDGYRYETQTGFGR